MDLRDLMPDVTLFVHLAGSGADAGARDVNAEGEVLDRVARVEGHGPVTLVHHRVKTHGDWQVRQPFPGIYLWRDAYGATYLVDHTGTRPLAPPVAPPPRPTRPPPPPPPVPPT